MLAIRLDKANLALASAVSGMDIDELNKKISESRYSYKKQQDKERFLSFVGKDEAWYEEAMQKIKSIRESLPKDMDHKEMTIRLYSWIADLIPHKNLILPLVSNIEYSRAYSIELMLHNPDSYEKMMRWD